ETTQRAELTHVPTADFTGRRRASCLAHYDRSRHQNVARSTALRPQITKSRASQSKMVRVEAGVNRSIECLGELHRANCASAQFPDAILLPTERAIFL